MLVRWAEADHPECSYVLVFDVTPDQLAGYRTAEVPRVFAGHGVEVLSMVQRDAARPPLFIRSKDDVYSFAQAGDWLATGILHLPS
jgi:hypothetical protein